MNPEEIRRAVHATLASIAPEADLQRIRPDTPLREQVDLDSLDWLNVIAGLHERLSVEFPAADHARLTTLDSIVAYVESRQARGGIPRALPPAALRAHAACARWRASC